MKKFNPEKFDSEFINIVESLADALEVDPAVFIENIIIRRLAEDRAADDVYGAAPQMMPEFIAYDGEIKRGHELYKTLYNFERERLERARLEQIQSTGIPFEMLPPEDKEILKRYKLDPEYKKEKEEAEKEIQRMIDSGELEEPIIEWNNKKE